MKFEPPPDPKPLFRAKQDIADGIRAFARYLQRSADEREIERCRLLMAKLAEDRFTPAKGESLIDFQEDRKRGTLLVSVLDEALVLEERVLSRLGFLKMAGEISGEEIGKKTTAIAESFQLLREARRKSFIEVRERIIAMEEKRISSAAGQFAASEAEGMDRDLHEILCRSSWTPVFRAARRFGKYASTQIARDIDSWAGQQVQRLNSELPQRFRDEWARVDTEFYGMRFCADEIHKVARSIDFRAGEGFERPDREMLPLLEISKMEWRPLFRPAIVAFVPICIANALAGKQLLEQMSRFIASFTRSAEENLLIAARRTLDGLGAEMEKRAAQMETEVLDAFRGKRPLRGTDGRFHAVSFTVEEIDGEMVFLAGIGKRLGLIRTRLLQAKSALGDEPLEEPAEIYTAVGVESRLDFDEDLKTRGCAVCNKMTAEAGRFLADRQYVLSNRESARREFADSLGFCQIHMWQLEALSSPHGLSLGLSTITDKLSADLAHLACKKEPVHGEAVRRLTHPLQGCAVCRLIAEVEHKYLDSLARFLRTTEGREAYACSQGVCLRHLGMLIAKTSEQETVRFLLDNASRLFLKLSEDMLNYALKRDALRGELLSQDEKDAYIRALVHIAGAKRICIPMQL
ncbi:MAG: DUF6062 family protein [Syntrophobacteraceae bacterium]